MIATEPDGALVGMFDRAGGAAKPKYWQLPVCYDTDEGAARKRARELWRWATSGWPVMAELPVPRSFDAASSSVTEDDVAELVPCGPDTAQQSRRPGSSSRRALPTWRWFKLAPTSR